MSHFALLTLHLFAAIMFVGTVFFEVLILEGIRKPVGRDIMRTIELAIARRARAKEHVGAPIQIDLALIDRFGHARRESLRTWSMPFHRAYLQSLINVIEVDDHQIRIKGSQDLLERADKSRTTGCEGLRRSPWAEWCRASSARQPSCGAR
jgi:hypothetical protein